MSRISDLIAETCSDGVPFCTLAEVANTVPGLNGKTKSDFSDGNARFVSYKNAFANLAVDQGATDRVKVRDGERQNRLHEGDVVITGSSESLDEVGMSSVVTSEPDEELYLNSFCFALRLNDPSLLLPGFSKYLFRSDLVRAQIRRSASGVTRINIAKPRFMKIRIPLPPVEIQRNIVRILDQFTQLVTELEAELEARQRQYEHYRQYLVAAQDGVREKSLGDVVSQLSSGASKSRQAEGEYPVFGSTGEIGRTDNAPYTGDTLLVARVGANAGRVNAVRGQYDVSDNTLILRPRVEWDVRFAFHQLTFMNLNQYAVGGGQPLVTGKLLKSLLLPLPSLDEQRRIAGILDKFNSLVNDLTFGIPAELHARRKQYEYYRDKLLTFEEVPV